MASDNRDLTPTSSKGQGLLALLATQRDMERGRTWLQDKLWSDRGQESGAASLRQELTQIRKRLGSSSYILGADRQKVWLDAASVSVVDGPTSSGQEFLEGVDIRDQEFADWLRAERSNRQWADSHLCQTLNAEVTGIAAARRPHTVVFVSDTNMPLELKLFEKQFTDGVSRSLRELTDVVVLGSVANYIEPGNLVVSTQVVGLASRGTCLRISIEHADGRGVVWSDVLEGLDHTIPLDENRQCLVFINRVLEALTKALYDSSNPMPQDRDAAALANIALKKIFSIDKAELESADAMLQTAHEIEPRGIFEAWRAQLLTIQFVERYAQDVKALEENCEACCANAIAADPTNSNVLAAVSNARTIIGKNHVAGGELAALSIRANPANPLAWWALSNAKQYAEDFDLAYAAAVHAQQLATGTRFEFWANFQRSLTASLTGRTEEAIRLGELSSALSPSFKPPLRYLAALYSKQGDGGPAARTVRGLSKLEPDFSLDRMANDPTYPVSIMRKCGLLDKNAILELDLT